MHQDARGGIVLIHLIALMSVSKPFVDLWNKLRDSGPRWLVALCVVVVSYVIARVVGKLVQKAVGRTSTQGHVDILIGRGVSAAIMVVGVMLALSEVGMSLSAALATLGLASVGIGFALQDILSNLFAGVILLVQHPFTIGDQIRIAEQEGVVENVRVRDTQVLTYDGERVFIPNRTVFSNPIINYSATPTLRRDLRIGIKYASEVIKARDIVSRTLKAVPAVLVQPEPVVLVEAEEDHVCLVIRFWTGHDRNRGLKTDSDITERLLAELLAQGIDFLHELPPGPAPPAPEDTDPDEGMTEAMESLE